MISAVIIDDEEDARESLRLAISSYCPEVQILEVCPTPESGIEAIRKLRPDLIFLDVQMPSLSGFDVLQAVSPVSASVIFVSAYDKYAIKAIRFSALDYLLKPVDIDELVHAVRRSSARKNTPEYESVLHNIQYTSGHLDRIAVPILDGIEILETSGIIYCRAEGGYTQLYLTGHRNKLISRNLKEFEAMLCDSGFFRVHHSFLINLKHVRKYVRGEGGYVVLSEAHHADISRRKKDEFIRLLDRL